MYIHTSLDTHNKNSWFFLLVHRCRDYYVQPYRAKFATFTDAWAEAIVGTLKLASSASRTVQDAINAGESVCASAGTAPAEQLPAEYPEIALIECASLDGCLPLLRDGSCSVYAEDSILLALAAAENEDLEFVNEKALPNQFYLAFVSRNQTLIIICIIDVEESGRFY
jgi:hypothetical protein